MIFVVVAEAAVVVVVAEAAVVVAAVGNEPLQIRSRQSEPAATSGIQPTFVLQKTP